MFYSTGNITKQDTEPTNVYYISLQIDNERSDNTAILKWVLPGAIVNEKPIPSKSSVSEELQIGMTGDPTPVELTAYDKVTNIPVKLNGNYKLHVTPSKSKQMIYVQLEDAGREKYILINQISFSEMYFESF